MKTDINKIVKEVLAENPDLSLEVSELQALVSELSEKRPSVTVDPVFRARLRAELLSRSVSHKEKRSVLPWWLIYTVPVGVTALLIFVIQPTSTTAPLVPTNTDSFDSAPSVIQMEEGSMMKAVDESNPSHEAGYSEDVTEASESFGSNDFFTVAFTPDRQQVRFSYLFLSAPAFISITGPEGIIFTSNLFLPGEHTNLMLPLNVIISSGATYTATLYYDNGDTVFTEGEDIVALNPTGVSISMTLIAP